MEKEAADLQRELSKPQKVSIEKVLKSFVIKDFQMPDKQQNKQKQQVSFVERVVKMKEEKK